MPSLAATTWTLPSSADDRFHGRLPTKGFLSYPPPPPEPVTLAEAGVSADEVEGLVLKTLLHLGPTVGSGVAAEVCLSRSIVDATLDQLRDGLQVAIKGTAGLNDFVYHLTEAGHSNAQRRVERARYTGPAPAPLAAYEAAIRKQSLRRARLSVPDLGKALSDLTLRHEFLGQVAQAIHDGRGMFLYGPPGNGKTTIAERVVDAFGQHIWIPKMVSVGGDLVRLYDPSCHEAFNPPGLDAQRYDRRWVLIRRPTVVAGGELALDQLDASFQAALGVSEAPIQLKANGGALLVDDFGRQRVSSEEILNRLIVPLEKGVDHLSLASGRRIQTPFEQLFILSTNLAPRELVDEAFLRRIPYKIEVQGPTQDQFRSLVRRLAEGMRYEVSAESIDYLLREHYAQSERALRFCHPRDLLRQACNYCEVHELPKVVTRDVWDVAVRNYFVGL
ncbi:hypothetical protein KOR34_32500 [Posidoniimonas corsicana]|uniref:AAA+ ATPase domain-containing protein n=1 Tax=Posidoniimonas corsicana TaxID=1938618 RepID=A0A5C5VJN2_9BACT|nr:AAA family ATPase [Posidoniimonas corsicana]TWT38281.1 hypothetical protein KOR34_32500 [Posidoniimonas corsicana]